MDSHINELSRLDLARKLHVHESFCKNDACYICVYNASLTANQILLIFVKSHVSQFEISVFKLLLCN